MDVTSPFLTGAYALLLVWGLGVGIHLTWTARRRPDRLLNPLFANPHALRIYDLHLLVATLDLLVLGPLAIATRSMGLYWGSRVALLSASIPLAFHLNRNTESFGEVIGRWVLLRNIFEIGVHVAVASRPVNWAHYHLLLWWLVGYRYLDVGPRRLLRTLYDTPARLAARPWAPTLNWGVITALYVAAFFVVREDLLLFSPVPPADAPARQDQVWERVAVITYVIVVTVAAWALTRRYTESLLAEALPVGGKLAAGAAPAATAPNAT